MLSWISSYILDKSVAFHLYEPKCASASEPAEWKFLGISDTWKGVHPNVFSSGLSGLITGQKACRKYRICIPVCCPSFSVDKAKSYGPDHH